MRFLNLGLPRSGLQSVSLAFTTLGLRTRPKKPFTHRDFLDRLHEVDLLQGFPFGAHYEKVIATLQSQDDPPTLFLSYRPKQDWLRSAALAFEVPAQDPWENQCRMLFFNGQIHFDPQAFSDAYDERLALARQFKAHLFPLHASDHEKWASLRQLTRSNQTFPHIGKTPKEKFKPPYQRGELVA